MKVGVRKPSIKKSIKARTTGRAKRALKSSIDPTYGKKGTGWIKDPKKAAYNSVYSKTTVSAKDLMLQNKPAVDASGFTSLSNTTGQRLETPARKTELPEKTKRTYASALMLILSVILLILSVLIFIASPIFGIAGGALAVYFIFMHYKYKKELQE